MHRFDSFTALRPAADIGLVGDDYENKAGCFQFRATAGCLRINLELVDVPWRKRKPAAHHWSIEDAVPIEKNRAPFYFVLSHFVCAVFSAG